MFQIVCLPLHTIQEEPLPVHLKNKIDTITFSLELFLLICRSNYRIQYFIRIDRKT